MQAVLGRGWSVTDRLNTGSGRQTGQLAIIIVLIIIAGPMVTLLNALAKIVLGERLKNNDRKNMYIWRTAPRIGKTLGSSSKN